MIYIIEDDDNIRKFVSYTLTKEGFEVKGFAKPTEFWIELSVNEPELILLDIMLPEEDGLSILKKLRDNPGYADCPVIMVTAKASEYDKVTGLDMGADDYIAKPFGMTELISRVRAVLRRYEKTKDKGEYRIGNLYLNSAKHIVKVSDSQVTLAHKEYQILLILFEANGNVVSRDTLFTKVWGEYYGESRTLDVHIGKLRQKLGDAGGLIHTIKSVGYRLGGDENES